LCNTSPLLFLAVVCIGTQFWTDSTEAPTTAHLGLSLHPRYFDLAARLDTAVSCLLLAPVPSDATLDSVCALLLYSQWMPYVRDSHQTVKSRYNDLSAWVVFGLAVRYATFLGLERAVCQPTDNADSAGSAFASSSTTDLARARVWLNLVTYDCNLTLTSGLPASIHIDPMRMESMARAFGQHRRAQFPGDVRYAALVELVCILQKARDAGGRAGGHAGGGSSHPNIDVLKRANMGFEDWSR
jgi:hypothetical protein